MRLGAILDQTASAYQSVNRTYLPAVDHLRAAAALLVLLYHGFQVFSVKFEFGGARSDADWLFTDNPLMAVLLEGHSGVALFMVLSGFILSYGAIGRDVDYSVFLRNRFLRIYPLFVALTVIGVFIYRANFSFLGLLQTLAFGANLPGALSLGSISGMFWTIAVEFQFYLVFPFLLAMMNARGAGALLLLVAVALMARTFALTTDTNIRDLSYWTIVGRIDQFLLGMLIARFVHAHPQFASTLGFALPFATAAVVGLLFAFNMAGGWVENSWWKAYWPTVEGVAWAVVIVCYLPVGGAIPPILGAPVAALGRISYSMYLLHFPIMMWLVSRPDLWHPFESGYSSAMAATLGILLPLTLVASMLTYFAIEKPFLAMRRRYVGAKAS